LRRPVLGFSDLEIDENLPLATRLVREDRERFGYPLSLHDDPPDMGYPPRVKWTVSELRRSYRDVMFHDPRFTARTQLGIVLRKHILLARTFPVVLRIRTRRRPYLDAKARPQVGYEFEIELQASSGETKEVDGQVWEEGRRVTSSELPER